MYGCAPTIEFAYNFSSTSLEADFPGIPQEPPGPAKDHQIIHIVRRAAYDANKQSFHGHPGARQGPLWSPQGPSQKALRGPQEPQWTVQGPFETRLGPPGEPPRTLQGPLREAQGSLGTSQHPPGTSHEPPRLAKDHPIIHIVKGAAYDTNK